MLASLTCALSACEKDEILPEPEPPVVTPGDDPGKEEEEKIRLGITASLQAMQTKGIIEAFLPGHEMGVFISTTDTGSPYVYNVPYAFDGKKWNAGGDAPVEGDSEVAAYLPYNGQASGDRLIPFELADQHDILYGRASVTRDIPTADIEMRHAMSLVRIKILKNEYMGVELFVNGESLGRKVLDSTKGRTASWQTPYRPGSVKVVAYDENGKVVATDEQDSFDDSAMVCLQADRKTISGDGRELAFITITTRDKNGNPVRNANDRVTVRVNGAGVLVGLDNGDSADPDEYQTDSRRLFSGMLLAVVAGNGRTGTITVDVTAPGLRPAVLTLNAAPFEGPVRRRLPPLTFGGSTQEIPVRKLALTAERTALDKEHPVTHITAARRPAAATFTDIEWQLTDDKGVPAVNAAMQPDGDVLTVTALGDGTLRVRALVRNGHDAPQLISQLELSISGVGQLHKNPYEFISASRFDASFGDIGNGNERGVSTSRTGRSWVLFDDIDFGPDGADTVELPIFALDGEPTTFRFWDGEPYAEGSTMIGERVYHKPKQWNVYQPDTFKLDKLLRGIGRFAVELNVKVHIKGFTFTRHSRAWDTLAAGACDAVYGDSFTRDGSRVLGIGNNVSLLFDRMDFGETGCCGIRITGRSPLPANTVHLMFAAADGGETERRVVEFGPQADWGEQTFTFEPVTGARQVTFLFLPGTQFDFDSFTFI